MKFSTIACVALLPVLLMPTTQAFLVGSGGADMRCQYNPGYVLGVPICSEPNNDTCDGAQFFVASDDKCHPEEGAGCDGIQVFIGSNDNCQGGPGENGCEGVRIVDPTSYDNCKGGPGSLLIYILEGV